MHGPSSRHVERQPAGVAEPAAEVAFVVVDEEVRVHAVDGRSGVPGHEERAGLGPAAGPGSPALALDGEQAVEEESADQRGQDTGEAPRAGDGATTRIEQL